MRVPVAGLLVAVLACAACSGGEDSGPPGKRVIVLGFDGMDHRLTSKLMAAGRMPHFSRLAEEGSFSPLGTSVPPQSPVAWSNFITGMDSGGHGIFDFLHREAETLLPYFSTSRTEDAESTIKLGKWQFPLSSGKVELLRRGKAFWEVLDENGIETTIIRMPANFPPSGTAHRELSGMGTPDIHGTYGIFSYYVTGNSPLLGKSLGGGDVYRVDVLDNAVRATLYGPPNPFLVDGQDVTLDFTVYLDPAQPSVKLVMGEEERVLQEGEWTDWIPIDFELIPSQSLPAICRVYLKQVRPDFELYVTPLNIDPMQPAMPISTPSSYAAELARATGRFYTQTMPEDTHALSGGVFDPDEFLQQARLAGEENVTQYKYVLDQFRDGLLFYYFGNVDQVSHMMWRTLDPEHPAYDPEVDGPLAGVMEEFYQGLDDIVGYTVENMGPDTTLIVMSDHGFMSWRRSFHLNAWLERNGYLAVMDPTMENDPGLFTNVDWSRTRAYGMGLNSLYINLRGRERYGIVPSGERQALMDEIAAKLLESVDPEDSTPAVTKVYQREEVYNDRGHLDIGPDMLVGYARGIRGSDASAMGGVMHDIFADNTKAWSGDHCIDHEEVPGVLLTNRPLKKPAPRLEVLAAAILAEFGIEGFPKRD